MKSKVKKKIQLKTTSVVSFVFMFGTIIVLALMLINSKDASAAYKMKVSDLIESVVSNDSKAAGDMLKENKIQDAVDQLLKQTLDMLVRSGNYEVTEEQSQQIEQSLRDMLTTMTEQDLIEFTKDGELSTFSKYYLADAVAYAVTSAIGNDTITVNQDTIDNQFVLENLNNDVLDLRVKYEALANKYESITGSKFDSNNFQEILNQYAILDKETYNQLTNGSNGANGTNGLDGESPESMLEMMLKIQALETMVKTLTNKEYNNTSDTLTSETVIQLDTITREIERIKESMSNGESPNPGDLYNISELTETLLKLSEKVNGMDLSGIDRNNASILIEIQERQNAITQLKEQIKEITNNIESTETKTLVEKLESMTKELETLKSQVTVQNTTNETNREVWTKETNTKIETILKQIETIQGADKTTSTTINNLKQTINNMQQTINNIQNGGSSSGGGSDVDLTDVYSSIAAVKLQIIAGSNSPLETAFGKVEGTTIAEKIGSIYDTTENINAAQVSLNAKIATETAEREKLKTDLQTSITNQYNTINKSIDDLQKTVNNGGSTEEIDKAKADLEAKIKELQDALTGVSSNNTELNQYISDLQQNLSTLNTTVQNVTNNNETINNQLTENQTLITEQFNEINNILNEDIEAERLARIEALKEIQSQISGSDTPLGSIDSNIAGDNLLSKLESVFNDVNDLRNSTTNKTDELASDLAYVESARAVSESAIRADMAKDKDELKATMEALQNELLDKASDTGAEIDETKNELGNALTELAQTFNSQITDIYNTSSDNYNNLNTQINAVGENSDRYYQTLGGQINVVSGASLGYYNELEGKIGDVDGASRDRYQRLAETDDWFTNIKLSLVAGKGDVAYTTIGDGRIMWDINQVEAPINIDPDDGRLIFREANDNQPESDITIVYEGAPAIVVTYKITDGHLFIYTPDTTIDTIAQKYKDQGFINIQTMHVQNAAATNEV